MRGWRKEARTLRLDQAKAKVDHIEAIAGAHEVAEKKQVEALQHNFKEFCERIFGFTPYAYQLDLEAKFERYQFNAVRWPRQTGKSFIVSGLVLKYAIEHPNSYIAIVGPSWRQTLRRQRQKIRRLARQLYTRPNHSRRQT